MISSADTCGTSRNRSKKWGGEGGRHEMSDIIATLKTICFPLVGFNHKIVK